MAVADEEVIYQADSDAVPNGESILCGCCYPAIDIAPFSALELVYECVDCGHLFRKRQCFNSTEHACSGIERGKLTYTPRYFHRKTGKFVTNTVTLRELWQSNAREEDEYFTCHVCQLSYYSCFSDFIDHCRHHQQNSYYLAETDEYNPRLYRRACVRQEFEGTPYLLITKYYCSRHRMIFQSQVEEELHRYTEH